MHLWKAVCYWLQAASRLLKGLYIHLNDIDLIQVGSDRTVKEGMTWTGKVVAGLLTWLDNVYEFDSDGDLIVDFDGTWLPLNRHIVACYVESIEDIGDIWSITGRIPAMLNDMLVDIIVIFNNDYPYGAVAGARVNYGDVTDTEARGLIEIKNGDVGDLSLNRYLQQYLLDAFPGLSAIGDGICAKVNI